MGDELRRHRPGAATGALVLAAGMWSLAHGAAAAQTPPPALELDPAEQVPGETFEVTASNISDDFGQPEWGVWWHDPQRADPVEIGTAEFVDESTLSGSATAPGAPDDEAIVSVCFTPIPDAEERARVGCPDAVLTLLPPPTTTTAAPTTTEVEEDTTTVPETTAAPDDATTQAVVVTPTTTEAPLIPPSWVPGLVAVGIGLAALVLLVGALRWRRRRGPPPEAPPRPPAASPLVPERWIEARLYAVEGATEVPVAYFRPETLHRIEVRLGPDLAKTGLPAPDRLGVVLTEPRLLGKALRQPLPPDPRGSVASFFLQTWENTLTVDARLIVVDGARILHTATLPAAVGAAPPSAAVDVASVETVVRAVTTSPHPRTVDSAILLAPGSTTLTGIGVDGAARFLALDDADLRTLHTIRGRLSEVVEAPDDFSALDSPGTRELLVFLAHHGVLLRSVVEMCIGTDMAGARSLQVVSAMFNAFLPIELCYDLPAPRPDAAVCAAAAAALQSPDPAATCPGVHDATVVCPFGFWAFTKVIERHAYQPRRDLPSGFLVTAQPVAGRDTLTLANGAVVAASDRVDAVAAGSIAGLVATVTAAAGEAALQPSWAAWDAHVASHSPATLVVLPHTVYSEEVGLPGMEIGHGEVRLTSEITPSSVPGTPSLVALLGCTTAASGSTRYEELPARFRIAGASIVIATFTEVLGRHAAPLAGRLVTHLHEAAAAGPVPVGEVMLTVRRRLLADGVPAVLSVGVFGDADWLVGPPP